MRANRNLIGLLAVAGLAFAAGHVHLNLGGPPTAWAGDKGEKDSAHMQAYEEAGLPGPAHQRLDALVGEWDGDFRIYMEPGAEPMTSRGIVTRKWILGKRFIQETVEATSDMGTFSGLGFIGYNNLDGQYEVAWLDDMSTGIYTETGTYDPDKKVFHWRGSHRDPVTGRVIATRSELDLSSPDRQVYAGYMAAPDGREFLHFEGVSTRTKGISSKR